MLAAWDSFDDVAFDDGDASNMESIAWSTEQPVEIALSIEQPIEIKSNVNGKCLNC